MTYRTKMRDSERRVKIIVPLIVLAGLFVCSVVYGYVHDGLSITASIQDVTITYISLAGAIIISTILFTTLVFTWIAITRAIKQRLSKMKDKE